LFFHFSLWELLERRLPWSGTKSFVEMEENVKKGLRLDLSSVGIFQVR